MFVAQMALAWPAPAAPNCCAFIFGSLIAQIGSGVCGQLMPPAVSPQGGANVHTNPKDGHSGPACVQFTGVHGAWLWQFGPHQVGQPSGICVQYCVGGAVWQLLMRVGQASNAEGLIGTGSAAAPNMPPRGNCRGRQCACMTVFTQSSGWNVGNLQKM